MRIRTRNARSWRRDYPLIVPSHTAYDWNFITRHADCGEAERVAVKVFSKIRRLESG